ncbi:DEAD-domain-containing protein [Patellaria atrata CBS 101060]|uniref:RNA helicase n=1 Tax=Patellaria atrata CBS 101060 TaxID=1346257 RepID=A0A9P4SAW9_9PEZI|nr:DEAD-domain-containing protein [Patellaria atrata CBS 101060]
MAPLGDLSSALEKLSVSGIDNKPKLESIAEAGDDSETTQAQAETAKEAATPAQGTEKESAEVRAKNFGWVDPEPFKYDLFNEVNVKPKDGRDFKDDDELKDGVIFRSQAWTDTTTKYEFTGEIGEVGERIPTLEKALFNEETVAKPGEHVEAYEVYKIVIEGPKFISPIDNFEDAGLHPVMLENIKLSQYPRPTPIQAHTIPGVLLGNDIVGCAQTGSGKTAAYLIPILSRMMGKASKLCGRRPMPGEDFKIKAEPLVVVVCPSRELALQIFDECRRLCYRSMLRPCIVYGGAPKMGQRAELQRGCDILIGTTGRLCDFLDNEPHVLSLGRVKYTVVDEADEMLNAAWEEELDKILVGATTNADDDHIFMMFSATFNKQARLLASKYMAADYIRIRVGRTGSTHTNITQDVIRVEPHQKREALIDRLFMWKPCRTIVFVNSKHMADLLDDFLYNDHRLPTTSIHSDRTQLEREDALRSFKVGSSPILIATGVMARGMDIRNVQHIINYDLPSADHGGIDEYIHRIGRTARMGYNGLATSFYTEKDEGLALPLVKILLESKQKIPDFLQHLVPEDGIIDFDDDTSDDEPDPDTTAAADQASGDQESVGGQSNRMDKADDVFYDANTEVEGGGVAINNSVW